MSAAIMNVLYCSRSAIGTGEAARGAIRDILAASRANNARRGITGALLFSNDFFAQVLEGSARAVEETFDAVRQDPRHRDVVVLRKSGIPRRLFPHWSMAFNTVEEALEDSIPDILERSFAAGGEALAPDILALIQKSTDAVQLW